MQFESQKNQNFQIPKNAYLPPDPDFLEVPKNAHLRRFSGFPKNFEKRIFTPPPSIMQTYRGTGVPNIVQRGPDQIFCRIFSDRDLAILTSPSGQDLAILLSPLEPKKHSKYLVLKGSKKFLRLRRRKYTLYTQFSLFIAFLRRKKFPETLKKCLTPYTHVRFSGFFKIPKSTLNVRFSGFTQSRGGGGGVTVRFLAFDFFYLFESSNIT